jgi:hypothetical protein
LETFGVAARPYGNFSYQKNLCRANQRKICILLRTARQIAYPRLSPLDVVVAMTRHANKPHIGRTSTSLQEMELWLGPSHHIGPTVRDDDERRRLWVENRERFMQLFAHGGRRPMAWWKFEAPFKYPGFNLERSTLWAAGLLGAAEARTLEASWREEFNRSLAPDFTFNGLKGRAAHIANLVFHDVPVALAERWAAADVAA